MMSLIPSRAMARIGNAQNGWIMLAVCSPIAVAIAVSAGSTFRFTAAGIMNGPCTAQCPPPEGTTRLMMLDETNDQNAKDSSVEKGPKAGPLVTAATERADRAQR